MNTVTEIPSSATAPLWERTRAMFARAAAAVGAPAAIAAVTLLPNAARAEITPLAVSAGIDCAQAPAR